MGGGSAPKPQKAAQQSAIATSVSAQSQDRTTKKKNEAKYSLSDTLSQSSVFSNNKLGAN